MPDIKIIEERPITMAEFRARLEEIEKRGFTLGLRTTKTKEFINYQLKLKPGVVAEIKKKFEGLNIPRLKDRHIVKIIDIMPNDIESLKILFTGESVTIKQEDMQKIFDVIKEY